MPPRSRLMSGMRPTGLLHLGNWLGALQNWVSLQDSYDCFFAVADWHALTTGYQDTASLSLWVREMVTDWLSAGLDPEGSTIFVQSHVRQHAELHLILSMVTPVSWLERCPTYKDQQQQLAGKDLATYGFLGYPCLQTADILVYLGQYVPVGEDQVPHLELSREIARRFNHLYGPILPEPQPLLNRAKTVPGIDGRKMSKSYGNDIRLSASPAEVEERLAQMVTDPARIRRADPGHPEVCPVHALYGLLAAEGLASITDECTQAKVGCVECKRRLAGIVNKALEPLRARRSELERQPGLLDSVLAEGARRAEAQAEVTMRRVREAVGL